MSRGGIRTRLGAVSVTDVRRGVGNLRRAVAELFDREFDFSPGYLTAILSGCLFAPSLLTFWFVNGVLDFSTAIAVGAVASPAGLQLRLLAYVAIIPAFLTVRVAGHLLYPPHRKAVLAGRCPPAEFLSLDWFSVAVLATGLPLALQRLGPWLSTNAVFLVGVFLLPAVLPARYRPGVRTVSVVGGSLLFGYAAYGGLVPVVPDPATVLGPVATARLSDATTARLFAFVNHPITGPVVIALFALAVNRVVTRPELRTVPYLRVTLPNRDPDRVVAASAFLGTVCYLSIVWLARSVA